MGIAQNEGVPWCARSFGRSKASEHMLRKDATNGLLASLRTEGSTKHKRHTDGVRSRRWCRLSCGPQAEQMRVRARKMAEAPPRILRPRDPFRWGQERAGVQRMKRLDDGQSLVGEHSLVSQAREEGIRGFHSGLMCVAIWRRETHQKHTNMQQEINKHASK